MMWTFLLASSYSFWLDRAKSWDVPKWLIFYILILLLKQSQTCVLYIIAWSAEECIRMVLMSAVQVSLIKAVICAQPPTHACSKPFSSHHALQRNPSLPSVCSWCQLTTWYDPCGFHLILAQSCSYHTMFWMGTGPDFTLLRLVFTPDQSNSTDHCSWIEVKSGQLPKRTRHMLWVSSSMQRWGMHK